MEYLEKESKEKDDGDASSSEIDNDALSKALGKRDYYGNVKGVGRCGVGVGYRKAFGKVRRKGSNSRDQEIAELKANIAQLKSAFEAHVASVSLVNMVGNKKVSYKPLQQPTIKAPKKCRLAVVDNDGNLVVVADGTCHPCESGVIHTARLLLNHYRVSIDNPYEEHKSVQLPVASPDGETELGKAKGYFVPWPMSMVLFEEAVNENKTMSQSKEGVGSCDTPSALGGDTQTDELNLVECELLHILMVEDNHQSVRVTFKAPLLYLKEDQDVWVTSAEVDEVVRGACINVSVIHVYIRYLVEEVMSAVHGEYITFLCPHRISAEECKRNFLDVVGYVKHVFHSELKKKHSMSRMILVPYNENNHWILMAIDLCDGIMYEYDPLPLQEPRQLRCDHVFDLAYKSYRARIKESTKFVLDIIRVECAQQTGGTDCGYYVMKYMHEIVKKVIECKGDVKQIKDYTTRCVRYSKRELDEIREQWAKFFRLNFLLS